MKYIQKTNYQFDLDQLNFEWNNIKDFNLTKDHWYQEIQTCLQHSETCVDKYTEGCGSIKRAGGRTERDFCLINDIYRGTLFETIINELNVVRSRIMISKRHTVYSIHKDRTKRSHLVLNTNPDAFFILSENTIEKSEIMHIPADGYIYMVDTTKPHTFVNAGEESRTHLVMCHG